MTPDAIQTSIPIHSDKEIFYVPQFVVYIRGKPLKANIVDDILQVTYKDNINEIDSFSLEVNNWDATRRVFKFAPPLKETAGVFDPGAPIELWMGYQNNLRLMLRGQITALDLSFSDSAAPTLTVRGLNELHQFRSEKHTRSWDEKRDTDIAIEVCTLPVKKGQVGMGLEPPRTNPSADEQPETFVFMNNQYDIVFLLERARRHGYEVYLENDHGKQRLFFGLSESKAAVPVYQLEWGKSLINFQPTLSTAQQVAKVTVRGWDRKSNKPIEESYSLEQLWKDEKKSPKEIARLGQIAKAYRNRTEVVTDQPVHSKHEANSRAKAILSGKTKALIEARGATVGLPDIRSGCKLWIIGFGLHSDEKGSVTGASSDFDGEYYVTETTHTIGAGGYRTEFSARQEKLGQPNQAASS